MGSVGRVLQKLRTSQRNCFTGSKAIQFSTPAPETCELCTFYGIRQYDGSRWVSIKDHLKRFPVLKEVPQDRLIDRIDPDRPYLTTEHGRDFSRRAALVPYISHKCGKTIAGSFVEGNVGILRGTNYVCFKKIILSDLDTTTVAAGYNEFAGFLTNVIKEEHGQWAVDHLNLDYDDWLTELKAKIVEDEDDLVFAGALLPVSVRAQVQIEAYRLAKKEFPARGKFSKAKQIITDLSVGHHNSWQLCGNNALLKSWMYHRPAVLPVGGNLSSPSAKASTSTMGGKKQPGKLSQPKGKPQGKQHLSNPGSKPPGLTVKAQHGTVQVKPQQQVRPTVPASPVGGNLSSPSAKVSTSTVRGKKQPGKPSQPQ